MAEIKQRSEFDLIDVVNPTPKDFMVRFNGEPYEIRAGEKRQFPQFIGRHVAKHLSDKMVAESFNKDQEKAKKKKEPLPDIEKVTRTMYDTIERRKFLFDILGDSEEVLNVLKSYPQFKTTEKRDGDKLVVTFNPIGEIEEWEDYITKSAPQEEEKAEGSAPERRGNTK